MMNIKCKTMQGFLSRNLFSILVIYLVTLFLLSRYSSLEVIGMLNPLAILAGAARWKVKGGLFSATFTSALLLSGYAVVSQGPSFLTILSGVSVYFILGITLGKAFARLENLSQQFATYFDLVPVMIVVLDREGRVKLVNRKTCEVLGYKRDEIVGKDWFAHFLPSTHRNSVGEVFQKLVQKNVKPAEYHENPVLTRNGQERIIAWHNSITQDTSGHIVEVLSAGEDITELKCMENRMKEQLQTLHILYKGAEKLLLEGLDIHRRAQVITRLCVEDIGVQLAWIGYAEPDGSIAILAQYPENHSYTQNFTVRWDESPYGQGPVGQSIRQGVPQVIDDTLTDQRFEPWREKALQFGFRTVAAFPLVSPKGTFGALTLYTTAAGFFTSDRRDLLQAFAHFAASALENAHLFEETEKHLQRTQILQTIDTAIAGSLDPRVTFNLVLEEITHRLGADAADILLFHPQTQLLEYVTGKGFHHRIGKKVVIRLGESLAGRVALEKRTLKVADLRNSWRQEVTEVSEKNARGFDELIMEEGFQTYYGIPLLAKRQLLGVLEIFQRTPVQDEEGWLEFLETLANQTAIAMDNALLLQKLERTNLELVQAYDATIEGWAYALDLRDQETEGHSQRVTEMTLRIAQKMGIHDEELVHIRRGALLHDIGKMGIPDRILLKPGPLDPEEWEIMKKHPIYAYEMLSHIAYLRPALDIPYAHHEKWDGSGYPRGLKGEKIPLSARIFAVADVFDALTSNRPYRKAWTKEAALQYIREEQERHFDRKVVEVFFPDSCGRIRRITVNGLVFEFPTLTRSVDGEYNQKSCQQSECDLS